MKLPGALVTAGGLRAGRLAVEGAGGQQWLVTMCTHVGAHDSVMHWVSEGWPAVVAALQLEAGQNVCLAVLDSSRLLVSRRGEPHFRTTMALLDPKTLRPTPWKLLRVSEGTPKRECGAAALALRQAAPA